VLSAVLSGVALVGCTSSSPAGSGSGGTTASPSPTPNGIENLTATEALTRANAAAKAAKWVHVKGTEGGTTLDLHVGNDLASGSVSENGLTAQLLAAGGHLYLKGDKAFWDDALGTDQGAKLVGKWVLADDASDSLGPFTDLSRLVDLVLSPGGAVTKGTVSTVDGRRVLGLVDSSDGSVLYLSTTGEPYPVTIHTKVASVDPPVFDGWGQPVDIKPPPASEVVDPGPSGG
jgi:hypothetical protein